MDNPVLNIYKRDIRAADEAAASELERDGEFLHDKRCKDYFEIMDEYFSFAIRFAGIKDE